ncbi:MAG TPA: hypothetical protein VG737_17405 [Cyclobacteriaceae bacterium]|nr:hypothetical protein [Cyclobacteriaceae bacterium]
MKFGEIRAFIFITLIAVSVTFLSCNKINDLFSTEDKEVSDNESAQESTVNELDDMATSVLNGSSVSGSAGGRTALADDRFACADIAFSDVNADKTEGVVTITFPANGCQDKKGNVRKGKITIAWTGGRWFKPGSSYTIKLDGYSINDIDITGGSTVLCTDYKANPLTVNWSITAKHTAVWPDGSTATRSVHRNRKWEHTATDDIFTVTNAPSGITCAEGTNRHGFSYKVFITTPLVYVGSCARASKVFIPLSGEKVITCNSKNGKTKSLTINYGVGECDNSYTATVGNISKTLTAKNDSSGD